MIQKMYSRGFTLIELLVVIAIIGILASVVLASLNTARDKGNVAAQKSSVNNARAQAELYYDDNSGYTGTDVTTAACVTSGGTGMFGDPKIEELINGGLVDTTSPQPSQCGVTSGASGGYVIAVELVTGGTAGDTTADAYCVDSTGNAGEYTYAATQNIANAVTTDADGDPVCNL